MDMKQLLIRVGESLVRKHGFEPAQMHIQKELPRSCTPLIKFLLWLDKTPEAREELEKEGLTFHRTIPW